MITILAECLHEFKFPGSSTIRADTVLGQEFGTASTMWPGSSSTVCEAARSNSIGSLFFLPCVITCMYASFVFYMLIGIKVRDLHHSICMY